MELTPERRQQIEEEEKQRSAEEQYREQVRTNLNAPPYRSLSPAARRAPEPGQTRSRVGRLLGILAIVIVGAVTLMNSHGKTAPAPVGSAAAPARTPSIRYI